MHESKQLHNISDVQPILLSSKLEYSPQGVCQAHKDQGLPRNPLFCGQTFPLEFVFGDQKSILRQTLCRRLQLLDDALWLISLGTAHAMI
jgi:hypothetical protein